MVFVPEFCFCNHARRAMFQDSRLIKMQKNNGSPFALFEKPKCGFRINPKCFLHFYPICVTIQIIAHNDVSGFFRGVIVKRLLKFSTTNVRFYSSRSNVPTFSDNISLFSHTYIRLWINSRMLNFFHNNNFVFDS